jgi:Methylamine utilisation protein MauE
MQTFTPAGYAVVRSFALEPPAGTLSPMVAQAWFLISGSLLVVSGIAKLADPAPTAGALRAANLPHRTWMARALGLAEVGLAATAIVFGGPAVLGVAGMYLAFGVFVVVAIVADLPLASCGCFGKRDTPPTWAHVVYNASAAVAAGIVWLQGGTGFDALAGLGWLGSAAYLGLVGLGTFASYLLLSELPHLRSAVRSA